MSQNADAVSALNRALLNASPEIHLLINDQTLTTLSKGAQPWLDSERLDSVSLSELFDEAVTQTLQQAISRARTNPDHKHAFELLLGPDNPKIWGYIGLKAPINFILTLVAIDAKQTVLTLRDVTQLRRLEKAHTREVMRDTLTGLRSHRALITVLEKALGEAQRFDNMRFALIIVDIDKFSDINDRFGWDSGDRLLKRFADQLSLTQRSSDFLCRFGDDQFAMLLSESDIGDAIGAAKRLQKILAELDLDFGDGALSLTLSCGASAYSEALESAQQMINSAQENLLIAKSQGGNAVVGPV